MIADRLVYLSLCSHAGPHIDVVGNIFLDEEFKSNILVGRLLLLLKCSCTIDVKCTKVVTGISFGLL